MDEDRPQAEAFAVRDGRFSFVGTGEEARAYARKLEAEGESAAVTDLAGRCVLPAFNDSHMHFIGFAKHFINVDLNGASGIREIRERIRRRAKERGSADTSWMEGTGWNQDLFTEGEKRYPCARDLDEAAPGVPVLVLRVCEHVGVLSSGWHAAAGDHEGEGAGVRRLRADGRGRGSPSGYSASGRWMRSAPGSIS